MTVKNSDTSLKLPAVATLQDINVSLTAALSVHKLNSQSPLEPPIPPTDEEKAFFELCKTFRKYQVVEIIVK